MASAIVFYQLFAFFVVFYSYDIWLAVATPHSIHYINDRWRWGMWGGGGGGEWGATSSLTREATRLSK